MFLSHWFELTGVDKVMAPMPQDSKVEGSSTSENNDNDNNTTTAMNNEEPEHPLWAIVAPRQETNEEKNGCRRQESNEDEAREEQMEVTKAPPAEMFRQQQYQLSETVQCRHCQKMTSINSKVSPSYQDDDGDDDDDDDEREINEQQSEHQEQQQPLLQQTLQEKEQLQTSLKNVTKEKRELEENIEKMRLELEVMKMKLDNNDDGSNNRSWQPTTPAATTTTNNNGVVATTSTTTTPASLASSAPTTNNETSLVLSSPHPQPPTDGDEAIVDEATYIQKQVLAAAKDTTNTLTSPSFIWERRKNIFERCSALPKKKKPHKKNGGGEEYSVNLKKIIRDLDRNPSLVTTRSANMPGLPDGYTLLHAAVQAGNLEVVEYLLQKYVVTTTTHDEDDDISMLHPILDLNVRDLQGRTALHICAEKGHVDILSVLERVYKELEETEQMTEEEKDEDDIDDVIDGQLSNAMDKLDTSSSLSSNTIPTTPAQKSRSRSSNNKSKQKSRSPKKTSSSHLSPKFAGPTAPVDLCGRTPFGYAAISTAPNAKKHRAQVERILYRSGDRSIVGERTPPRERSGGLFTPPRGESGRKVGFHNNNDIIHNSGESGDAGGVVAVSGSGLTYLSPTPRKTAGRAATPFHSTPSLSSAMKTVPEETIANSVAWGAAEMPGKRIDMEDAILCKYPLDIPPKPLSMDDNISSSASSAIVSAMGIFAVFDGHGDGGFASQYISSNLISKLQSNPSWNMAYHEINLSSDACTTDTVETIFTEACYDLDDDLKDENSKPRDGGTTAIVALVSSRKILVANIGDSRCILVKKRTATNNQDGGEESNEMSQIEVIPMSEDHKPDLPDERARIESAGLEIHVDQIPPSEDDENGRYEMISKVKKSDREMLGVARAFGDYDYKSNEELSSSRQAVVCTPDIVVRDRVDSDDMFLVLACDGVWDVMSNDEVGSFVARGVNAATSTLAKEDQPAEADVLASVGDGLLEECLEKGSADNMSVLIVALPASGLSVFGNASVVTARALAFE